MEIDEMPEFYTENGLLIAIGYAGRKVISERDGREFYEFEYEHLVRENIRRKWKRKPRKSVYYIWWESNEKHPIKIYEVNRKKRGWKKPVNYADYRVGLFYIDTQSLVKR